MEAHPLHILNAWTRKVGYNLVMARKILVVDDTLNVQVMLNDFLSSQDYEVLTACDGREAMDIFHQEQPDLVLLDIMMPNVDGYQFITQLRKESITPVIMITARQQEVDLIKGFDLGADDYITKPFRMRELLVRMRAVLRRSVAQTPQEEAISIGEVSLDRSRHEVIKGGETLSLTPLEFKILELLMQSRGNVVRRVDLGMYLMENGFTGSEATIKIHIHNLRNKLEDDLEQPKFIETVFGVGYRFLEQAE